jgi:DNA polymerase III epsilon subunit-like protein
MKLLIFDTETTGLPRLKIPAKIEPNNWPHIVSISWVILDSDTNQIIKEQSFIVKPLDWEIPEESVKIHGITQQKALSAGEPLTKVMTYFLSEQYDLLVAHNLEFDYNVVMNAIIWDLELAFIDFPKKRLCTMELSRDICRLKNMFGSFKYPKLSELYEHVFKKKPNEFDLHNSMYDTKILTEIIQHCHELRLKMNLGNMTKETIKNESSKNRSDVLSLNLRD